MKKFKNIVNLFIISILVLLNITGCSNKEKEDIQDIFLSEEKIGISDEINKIFKIVKQDDESLIILGSNNNDDLVYFKVDNDFNSWKEIDTEFIRSIIKGTNTIISTDLNSDGKIIFHYLDNDNSSERILFADINTKEIIQLDLESEVRQAYISNKDLIVYSEVEDKVLHYDIHSNKLIREYNEVIIPNIELSNNKLIIDDSDKEEIDIYDIETGEHIKSIDKISDYNNYILFTNKDSDDIYFKINEGVYKYKYDNNEVELLFNIDNTQLSNTDMELNKFVVIDDNTILTYGRDNEDNEQIYKYTFGDSTEKISLENNDMQEFVIYSLYENDTIRNYVLNFKYDYPEINFKYTYGISEDKEITENDAITTLNTELLAGKGPDILFLDYLNIDSYIEKGLLENINEIVVNNHEILFSNIVNAYAKDDVIYAVPTAFNMPIIIGENVSNIKDLNSLISRCEENIENEEIILNISSAEELIDTFYESISTNILRDDKTLNIDAIEDALNKFKNIYDLTVSNLSESEEEIIRDNRQYSNSFLSLYLVNKNANMNISNIKNYKDILFINGIKEQYKCDYTLWNGDNGSYFKAIDVVGINSNSKNKDIAKEFVNSLLNGSFYSSEFSNLSVNRDVFKHTLNSIKNYESGVAAMDENGEGDVLEAIKLQDQDIENIINDVSSLNKAVTVNNIILDKIKDEIIEYIEGEINIEEALKKINNNLEIYLSE